MKVHIKAEVLRPRRRDILLVRFALIRDELVEVHLTKSVYGHQEKITRMLNGVLVNHGVDVR